MRTPPKFARALAVRALLIGFGLLLGLVALELILRAAGPLLRPPLRGFETRNVPGPGGAIRVLCAGDSHTFGVWVKPEESYPARLQVKAARWPRPVVVLNAGVPGMNSSQLRDVMPKLVREFQPDVVLVMVGAADAWNLAGLRTEELGGWRYLLRGGSWWDRSRVVKLARLIRFNLQHGRQLRERKPMQGGPSTRYGPAFKVADDPHFGDPIGDDRLLRRVLRRDLALIVSEIQAQGAEVILLTYATDAFLYGMSNEVYRSFARDANVPLIDLAASLSVWSSPPREALAFFPDFHPRPAAYELIARELAKALPSYLGFDPVQPGQKRRRADQGP